MWPTSDGVREPVQGPISCRITEGVAYNRDFTVTRCTVQQTELRTCGLRPRDRVVGLQWLQNMAERSEAGLILEYRVAKSM